MRLKVAKKLARELMKRHKPKGIQGLIWHNEAVQILKDAREFGIDTVIRIHPDVPKDTVQRISRLAVMVDIWIE